MILLQKCMSGRYGYARAKISLLKNWQEQDNIMGIDTKDQTKAGAWPCNRSFRLIFLMSYNVPIG